MSCCQTRIVLCFILALLVVWVLGMIGFVILYQDDWVDAFFDVAVIITTIAIPKPATTTSQKLFIAFLSIVGCLLFLCICGVLIVEVTRFYDRY